MHLRPTTVIIASLLIGTSCAPADDQAEAAEPAAETTALPGPGEPDLDAVRAATERFRDVNVALAEGYIPDPSGMCVTAEMEGRPASDGAMGIHYLRPDLLALAGPPDPLVRGSGTHTDFLQPAVLLYEPQADGSLELVAVENLAFRQAWRDAGHAAPPTFHGVAFDEMENNPETEIDEAHGFEPHFDRHVWLYRDNPDGIFAPFNRNVTCAHAPHAHGG
ncbi:hypothetical protein BH23GEM9_BH23GEM9_26400 [soil metagenome]